MLERARNSFAEDSPVEEKPQSFFQRPLLSPCSSHSSLLSSESSDSADGSWGNRFCSGLNFQITSLGLNEFRESNAFAALESSVALYNQLLVRPDRKFDFDSEEGLNASKAFLDSLQELIEAFEVSPSSRFYRKEFTHAYRVLYTEGNLSFLTEIIDSAQESIPYLWVNGEKYVFSNEVIQAGNCLYEAFLTLTKMMQVSQVQVLEGKGEICHIVKNLQKALNAFDSAWAEYEHMYVLELMVIEADARRFIAKAIQLDTQLSLVESQDPDSPEYVALLKKFVRIIGKINSVANTEGRGRDDLTSDILIRATALDKSKRQAVQSLAAKVTTSFEELRSVFGKYALNIEEVDPQLKNNEELVQALMNFESNWEKAKTFLGTPLQVEQLVNFAEYIERVVKRNRSFREQVECRDAEAFITIPALLVLVKLSGKDRDLCKFFCPNIDDVGSRQGQLFKTIQNTYKNSWGLTVSRLEQALLTRPSRKLELLVKNIKELAMELQRHSPADWNLFLDVLLG